MSRSDPVANIDHRVRAPVYVLAVVAVLTVAACGDDGDGGSGPEDAEVVDDQQDRQMADDDSSTGSDAADATGAGDRPAPDPGAYPNEPQFAHDLSSCPDWVTSSMCSDGTFTLGGDADVTLLPLPQEVEPGNRGTLAELAITSIDGEGEVGLACRSSFDTPFTGYALTGNHEDGWTLWRFEDGAREVVRNPLGLESSNLGAGDRERAVLRLGCGWGTGPGEQIGLLYAVDSQPVGPVTPIADESALDVDEAGSRVGIVAIPHGDSPLDVEFQELTLRLAE